MVNGEQSDLLSLSSRVETLLKIRKSLATETGIDLAWPKAQEAAWHLQIICTNELASIALSESPMASNVAEALALLQANNPNEYRDLLRREKRARCLYYALATGMAWANYPGKELPSPKSVSGEYFLTLSDSLSNYSKMLKEWEEYKRHN
jgi:hypothetical protein